MPCRAVLCRMIDMGFEDQVLAVLDAMGGTLKADDEQQAYLQELRAKEARNTKDLVSVCFACVLYVRFCSSLYGIGSIASQL